MISSVQQLIEQDEGRRIWPYTDTKGHITWGIGHLMATGIPMDVEALLNQAVDLQYQHDLSTVTQGLDQLSWFGNLDPIRQAVLIDMAFNLGVGGLHTFTTFLGLTAKGAWSDAAVDLRTTRVYSQLPTRYARLARMIETGEWPS